MLNEYYIHRSESTLYRIGIPAKPTATIGNAQNYIYQRRDKAEIRAGNISAKQSMNNTGKEFDYIAISKTANKEKS